MQWYIDNGYLPDFNSPYKYLYNRGNMCEALSGGWNQGYVSGGGGQIVFNANNISLATKSNSSGSWIGITSNNAVDLTNINELKIKLDLNTSTDTKHAYFFATKTKNGYKDSAAANIDLVNGTETGILNVRELTGNYYICFIIRGYGGTSNAAVYEIYGE